MIKSISGNPVSLWCSLFFLLTFLSPLAAAQVSIIPQPQKVKSEPGFFALPQDTLLIALTVDDTSGLGTAMDALQRSLLPFDCKLKTSTLQDAQVIFVLSDTLLSGHGVQFDPDRDRLGEEGYQLLIDRNRITASARTTTGLFYAAMTLVQMLRGHPNGQLPCLRITDWPDLPIRGILDDISRGPIPTMDFFKQCIRRFAEMKINALTYYTENVVRTEKHGDFAPPGALTLEEIRELSAYAQKYHIDLMGCFQSFGHFEKILEYPQYEHLGEMGSLLSPAVPESYQLLADIYAELAPAYSSKYFLVLGDELWALGKGASESMLREKGVAQVFAEHINWIDDELAKYDKQILVTADEPLKHPEAFELLHKDIILLPWDYSAKESFADMLSPIRDHGFQMLVTPGIACWRKIFPDLRSSRVNIKNFIRDGLAYGAAGVLTTTWDDWGINFFSNNWYGVAWAADQSWHCHKAAEADFAARFSAAVYGDQNKTIGAAVESMASLFDYPELQDMEATVFWNSLIPEKGSRAQMAPQNWSAIRDQAAEVKKTLSAAEVLFSAGDADYLRFVCDQLIYMADYRLGLVGAAAAYREACITQNDRDKARDRVQSARQKIAELRSRWQALQQTYDKLWLTENRPYWLENVDEKFEAADEELSKVIVYLDRALYQFDRGFPLPPPTRVRLDIRTQDQHFFQTWLLCGSFPNPKKDLDLSSHAPGNCLGFDADYLQPVGGERAVAPSEGDRVPLSDGSSLIWKRHTTPLGAKIDLKASLQPNERTVAYAYCEIESPDDRIVTAALGSNDGIKVFLNGERVFEKHELRFVKIDEDSVRLNLKRGVNRVLLKIDQGRGKWGFVFRLIGHRFMNRGYRYYLKSAE